MTTHGSGELHDHKHAPTPGWMPGVHWMPWLLLPSELTRYGFANTTSPAASVNFVDDEYLGSVTDIYFAMYGYRLDTNTLNDDTWSPLSTSSDPHRISTYLYDDPQSMTNSDLCMKDYEVVVQAKRGVRRTIDFLENYSYYANY